MGIQSWQYCQFCGFVKRPNILFVTYPVTIHQDGNFQILKVTVQQHM